MNSAYAPGKPSRSAARALWCAVILLVLLGVTASTFRAMFPGQSSRRAEPVRAATFRALNRHEPADSSHAEAVGLIDGKFGAHRLATWMHVIPGAIFLILAPLQFSPRVRRHLRFHRWSGRLLVVIAFLTVLPGFYFGLLLPVGGAGEAVVVALAGAFFLGSLVTAVVAVRHGDAARHREWMIRAFAIAIGISTIRVLGAVMDLAFTPLNWPLKTIFVVSLWLGWALTLGAAEIWILQTRPRPELLFDR